MIRLLFRRISMFIAATNVLFAAAATLIGLFIVIALLQSPLDEKGRNSLVFRVISSAVEHNQPMRALAELEAQSNPLREVPTHRSEDPFWLLTTVPKGSATHENFIEIPSRHTTSIEYWFFDERRELLQQGSASRRLISAKARVARAGFAITIPDTDNALLFLAKITSTGPARLSIDLQNSVAIEIAEKNFNRGGGVLFGSLLMIAAFSFLVALLSKDFTFLLFGAWVISSLRLASFSSGWDMGWLGYPEVEEHLKLSRNIPLAMYAFFTVALFWAIFKKDVVRTGNANVIRILFLASTSLIVVGSFTEHRLFLPILWGIVTPGIFVLIYLTIRIYLLTGSQSASWYGASWIAALVGLLGDVSYATGFSTSKPAIANSIASSIAAALLAGIALSQRMNSDREARRAAQESSINVLRDFRENYNSMPVGLFSLSQLGELKLFNPTFREMAFTERNTNTNQLQINRSIIDKIKLLIPNLSTANVPSDFELHLPATDTQPERWFLTRVASKGDSIEGSIQEITTRKQAEEQLRHLVDHDPLTGLLNQRGLEQALSDAQSLAAEGIPSAVAQLSLDRFKLINDLYGHATGDVMLQQAAARLKQSARGRDRIARLADSFIVVFIDCPDFAILGLSERLREAINVVPFELDGKRLDMTASVGVVGYDTKLTAVDTVVAAGRACAEAKSRGRNCVVRLDDRDSRLRSHLDELKVVANLKQKLNTDRYFLDFQPIVSLHAPDESLSYEVLLRMRDEGGGVIPPGRFIGAAERNGLMSDIDRWVLRSTLEWMDANPVHRDRLNFATINISGASLNDARFVDDAFAMIADHPLAMPKLCFEITESVALIDIGSTRRFIDRVRMYGSKLALDDFGAGYTSFNYLKDIPADFIKIDGSFVKDINLDPANYAITRTIVDLTHELGMRSIAEWAETPDTVATLIELQVDYGQGFGLVRPMDKQLVTAASSGGELIRDEQVRQLFMRPADSGISQRRDAIRRPR